MPMLAHPYIILIDDDVNEDMPLVELLKADYDDDNVKLFQDPQQGVEFILANLPRKMIVLLDIMFDGRPKGFEVFKSVLERSSLVCFVIMTGSVERIDRKDLVQLINGHAWYLIPRDSSAKSILELVRQANDHLALRIDGAFEEWILRHSEEEQSLPFVKTRSGEAYSLKDILSFIRTGTNRIGQEMVNSIVFVALDILERDRSKIGNTDKS